MLTEVMKQYEKEYDIKRQEWLHGEISDTMWGLYCMDILESLMEANKEILERMKNN